MDISPGEWQDAASEMKISDFLSSKWCRKALTPEAQAAIVRGLPGWRRRIRNAGILEKSGQLWRALTGQGTSNKEKVLIAGALLYLMTRWMRFRIWFPWWAGWMTSGWRVWFLAICPERWSRCPGRIRIAARDSC